MRGGGRHTFNCSHKGGGVGITVIIIFLGG